ncbi:MAG: ABC transporter ATP-binding protein [Oscillospiraceae bacterium]|jgi:branched-chain amino acid transport system ATP-binding protein|nr:ABC transporter ATP-binding protein [Oscillospiraceae bacterium]
MALLEVRDLKVSYGPIQAVRGIDLDVEEGQIVALLGANGAGKTTTLRAVSGIIKPTGGSVCLGGQPISKRACRVVRQGVSMSPEGRLVFYGLTVEENLRAGAYTDREKGRIQQNLRRIYGLFPVLEQRKKQQASTLSGGEQQMLAIGRALMANPKVLLLDEPSLGLAPLVIKDIFNVLQELRREGSTILIVEQNALATLKIADYAYVLELGSISMSGPAAELIHDQRLIDAYLGGKKA